MTPGATAPSVTFNDGTNEYNAFALAPASGPLKAQHTLLRIRGSMYVYFPVGGISGTSAMVWQSIQVVRLRSGDVVDLGVQTVACLQQLDQDNLSLIYQAWHPAITIDIAGTDFQLQGSMRSDGMANGNVDFKTKRRIDFSEFTLVHVIGTVIGQLTNIRVALHLRGLFAADGAL